MRVLLVTWDGPGTSYHESLFVPLFARLQAAGVDVHMLQFTWAADERSTSIAHACARAGIAFTTQPVWRRPQPLATAATIAAAAWTIARHARRHAIDVVMPRSIIPVGIALLARRLLPGIRLVYDADGLMADERVDFGGWSRRSFSYRLLRRIERSGLLGADAVTVRTRHAKSILLERGGTSVPAQKIHVIPNGKDRQRFHPGDAEQRMATRLELDIVPATPLVVYAGSLGPQYHAPEMLQFMLAARAIEETVRLLVLTPEPESVARMATAAGLPMDAIILRHRKASQVPKYLAAADLGLALRTPAFSQQGVSPIKVAEYLLCGVPVLGTSGIGDLDSQLDDGVGRLLPDLHPSTLRAAAHWFLTTVTRNRARYRTLCRDRGVALFGLHGCASRYHAALLDGCARV